MRRGTCILSAVVIGIFSMGLAVPMDTWAEGVHVKVGGTEVGLGVMYHLAKAFENTHPKIHIQIVPTPGSSEGIKAVEKGALDVAVSLRPLNADETGNGVLAREVARSPLVFIVNRNVRIGGITTQELEYILSGRMAYWPDGTRVRPVLRPETETSTKIIREFSPGLNRAMTLAMAREGIDHAVTDQENVDVVEKIDGGLGASSLTQLYSEIHRVRTLSFNGVRPSPQGIAAGSYPLFFRLYLVTAATITPEARSFVQFIQSREGGIILGIYGNMVVGTKGNTRQ